MTTIDGGVLIVNDESRLDETSRYRWFRLFNGLPTTEVDTVISGYKCNMYNVASDTGIGLTQLKVIGECIERHVAYGHNFDELLASVPGLSITSFEADVVTSTGSIASPVRILLPQRPA